MLQQISNNFKEIIIETINKLSGSDKRLALAKISSEIGIGGQTLVSKEFKVGRDTIRKGLHEYRTGIVSIDAFNMRGRHKITKILPNLEEDLKKIIDSQSQTDPTFKTNRLYTRISLSVIKSELKKTVIQKVLCRVIKLYQPF